MIAGRRKHLKSLASLMYATGVYYQLNNPSIFSIIDLLHDLIPLSFGSLSSQDFQLNN